MKNKSLLTAITFLGVIVIVLTGLGCKKTNDSNTPQDEVVEQIQAISEIQSLGNDQLTIYLQTQDTAEALVSLKAWFENDPAVDWAKTGSQGVMVLYKNGLRGGILIDGNDTPILKAGYHATPEMEVWHPDFKSTPSKPSIYFLNPHRFERENNFNEILTMYNSRYKKVMKNFYFESDLLCTVDLFTHLSDCSYIHIYSHGIAWPNDAWIDEVYVMTGNAEDPAVTNKYKDMIKSGDLISVYQRSAEANMYYISPKFITHYNDFSKDTVLFYGGFCYSFKGSWPELTNSFADGAYFGFTWSVRSDWNSRWSQYLFSELSDTLRNTPLTVEEWMNGTSIPKEYFDPLYKKSIKIQYSGNAELALWLKKSIVQLSIKSTEQDEAPIKVNGMVNKPYNFMCQVSGGNFNDFKFKWNKGDGSPVVETSYPQAELTWSDPGTYTLKVEAYLKSTNQKAGEISVPVSLVAHNYLNIYTNQFTVPNDDFSITCAYEVSCQSSVFRLRYDTLINNSTPPDYYYIHQLALWEKKSFAPGETRTYTITFTLSNLTTTQTGNPQIKKVSVQVYDLTGGHYLEFDGLTPITISVVTDETHAGSFSTMVVPQIAGSGSYYDPLSPLDFSIFKDSF